MVKSIWDIRRGASIWTTGAGLVTAIDCAIFRPASMGSCSFSGSCTKYLEAMFRAFNMRLCCFMVSDVW